MKSFRDALATHPEKFFFTALCSAIGAYYVTKNLKQIKSYIFKTDPEEDEQQTSN